MSILKTCGIWPAGHVSLLCDAPSPASVYAPPRTDLGYSAIPYSYASSSSMRNIPSHVRYGLTDVYRVTGAECTVPYSKTPRVSVSGQNNERFDGLLACLCVACADFCLPSSCFCVDACDTKAFRFLSSRRGQRGRQETLELAVWIIRPRVETLAAGNTVGVSSRLSERAHSSSPLRAMVFRWRGLATLALLLALLGTSHQVSGEPGYGFTRNLACLCFRTRDTAAFRIVNDLVRSASSISECTIDFKLTFWAAFKTLNSRGFVVHFCSSRRRRRSIVGKHRRSCC